ncbi:MAG: hypothetical protein PHH59_00565 [Methylovulum sp.]|uniref:hypothetical protein n=1 Tax=Methylovulum sp. TaxID=1916980 RepID=UPI00262ACBDD|nr:hypothetical protein [Methylovulum sp.]MDD2722498.1 hypothetical protein [Methylovulum sp.]MDD5125719.1 hypothetical protein [Methylovulum sp.]
MKACESCAVRVEIGKHHDQMPAWKRAVGMVLVYLPILTLPFVILSAYMTYYHLLFVGAKNVKTWSDFIPDRASHRYTLKNQITMKPTFYGSLSQYKLFWILNCTWYCPYSVALFEWHAYMVKIVENWWCPFGHDKKHTYSNAPIDKSFWHIYPHDNAKLTDEDRNNPIWNESSDS